MLGKYLGYDLINGPFEFQTEALKVGLGMTLIMDYLFWYSSQEHNKCQSNKY